MVRKWYTLGIQEMSGFIRDFIGFKKSNEISRLLMRYHKISRDLKGSEEISLNNFLLLYLEISWSGT